MTINTRFIGRFKGTPIALSLLAAGLLAAGCGGGSGETSKTLAGTLQDQNGAPLAGYRVLFDNNSQLATTTAGGGLFRIVVPNGNVTGQDTIYIYNAAGTLEDIEPLPNPFTSIRVFRATIPSAGPPTPPGV